MNKEKSSLLLFLFRTITFVLMVQEQSLATEQKCQTSLGRYIEPDKSQLIFINKTKGLKFKVNNSYSSSNNVITLYLLPSNDIQRSRLRASTTGEVHDRNNDADKQPYLRVVQLTSSMDPGISNQEPMISILPIVFRLRKSYWNELLFSVSDEHLLLCVQESGSPPWCSRLDAPNNGSIWKYFQLEVKARSFVTLDYCTAEGVGAEEYPCLNNLGHTEESVMCLSILWSGIIAGTMIILIVSNLNLIARSKCKKPKEEPTQGIPNLFI